MTPFTIIAQVLCARHGRTVSTHIISPNVPEQVDITCFRDIKTRDRGPSPTANEWTKPRAKLKLVWIYITLFRSIDTHNVKAVHGLPLQQRNALVAHGYGGRHAPSWVWWFPSLSSVPLEQLSCAGIVTYFLRSVFRKSSYCFLPWDLRCLMSSHREFRQGWQYTRCCHFPEWWCPCQGPTPTPWL